MLKFWAMVVLFLIGFLLVCWGADMVAGHLEAGRAPGELMTKFWADGKI